MLGAYYDDVLQHRYFPYICDFLGLATKILRIIHGMVLFQALDIGHSFGIQILVTHILVLFLSTLELFLLLIVCFDRVLIDPDLLMVSMLASVL